ncbi:MAG: TolC family protein, partial [Desulfomonilaceae bacterium]
LQAARLNGEPGMFSTGIVAVDIVLRMPLFTGGRIRNEIGAADLATLAAEDRLARTWEELIFNISSAYYTILGQKKVLESLNFSREVLTKHNRRVEDLMSVGKAARVDVLRTEVRIADLDQKLERERNVMEIQRRVLTSLIGAPLTQDPVKVQGNLNLGLQPLDLRSAMAMAFSERGDYRAARASLDAQALKVRASAGALWPKVSVDGSIGMRSAAGIDDNGVAYTRRLNITTKRSADSQATPSTPLLREPWPNPDSTLPVGSMGIVVDYPIFDGGRIRSQISEHESRFASLQQQLRKLELQIRRDVETALLNVSSARRRAEATRKAIEQSKESVRIEIQKFDLGKGSITDVLDAQSAMLEAETTHYRALSDYNIAIAQLDMATGQKR